MESRSISFYLHSNKNRRLYPSIKYPITHLIDSQTIQQRLLKQPIYVKHFKYTFFLLLLFSLISTIFFRVHIYVYNSFLGPFHHNIDEFIQHIRNFENGQSWFKKIEFIQIELGENNIQNSINTQNIIRKYSDPYTRRNHIATYKKAKNPNIYIKLPTRLQQNFHAHHPFHFPSYSIRTLQCIVKYLQSKSTYKTWIEKSEYVKYINEEYSKNSTAFNILILSKCGILIGYLYRPVYDKAFLPTREYKFHANDITFDATRQYCSFYPLLLCSLIFIWLFLKALFYLLIYLSNSIRYKLFHRIGFLSFPLKLSEKIIEELWLLNIEDIPYKQLLQFDEFIHKSKHKFQNKLFIIENHFQQLFVVLFQQELHDELFLENDSSPFIICPVKDIKIVRYGGIYYGKDLSWIPWPFIMTNEENYADWLHEKLMEISEDYKNQYEYRLKNEQEIQPSGNFINERKRNHRQRHVEKAETPHETNLKQFIREEKNFQRIKLERQSFYEFILEQATPASPQFIANFRMQQESNKNLIDSTMKEQELKCIICFSTFELDDSYTKWPCKSETPHIYHSDCMLEWLRRKNTCPICRHPVETSNDTFAQFMTQLVF